MLFRLAWRNVWRRKRRTAITLLSIALGTALCIFFTGISDGMYGKVITMAVKIGAGHLTLESPDYRDDPGLSHTLRASDELLATTRAIDDVEVASPRVSGAAMISSSHGTVGGSFDAVVPAIEQAISPLARNLHEGTYLEGPNDILIGVELARKLQTKIGGKVVVTAQDRSGETAQELFRVAGIFQTHSDTFDGFYFQFALEKAQSMLGLEPDEVTQVAVYLDSVHDMNRVAEAIAADGELESAGAVLRRWEEVLRDLATYIQVDNAGNYIFQGLLFFVILAGVLNTVLMSVLERTYEFGVMLSVGMKRAKLIRLVALECALMAVMGTVLGGAVGWLENALLNRFPIRFGSDVSDLSVGGFFMEPSLEMNITTFHFGFTLSAIFLTILLVGMYPAWKAGQVDPVEALQTI